MLGLLTPLQLIAAGSLLNNQGIKPLPSTLTSAISTFNNTPLIAAFLSALSYYQTQSWANQTTLSELQTIGNAKCPALGNSIPEDFTTLTPVTSPGGFSGLITQTGNAYLGNGDAGRFAQGFMAVDGFINSTNLFINSLVNAQSYLGPTFTNMNALITNNVSAVNPDFAGFGIDLANQGKMTNLARLDLYGTPAGLLMQIAKVAKIQGGTLKVIEIPLLAAGLTISDIKTLVSGQLSVTENQFNQLQKLAYEGMSKVTGADLDQVLTILNVTTPNILVLTDLLDQKKIFPNSYGTLTTITPNGPMPVYQDDGSVNMTLANSVDLYLPTPTGCEDLGKIVPPDQAVASKAVQIALTQITGITSTSLPELAQAVWGSTDKLWNVNYSYLINDVVSNGNTIPKFYRAQQNVPSGIDLNNVDYWKETSLGGLSTLVGLPDIQSLKTVMPQEIVDQYADIATGSGENGTINMCDVIGLAIDYNDFASRLNSSAAAINGMPASADLTSLITAYQNMLTANNNSTMQIYISDANNSISRIADPLLHPEYVSTVTELNSLFNYMALILSKEKNYQTQAGIDYFANIESGDKTIVYAFVQNLSRYGLQVEPCGAAYFLNQLADISIIGGQAMVGTMREAVNSRQLNSGRIGIDVSPSYAPEVIPSPVIVPVY
jgi:hypothetical protein